VFSPDGDLMQWKYVVRKNKKLKFLLHACETVGIIYMYIFYINFKNCLSEVFVTKTNITYFVWL
jgi:hypothetical protein